MKQKKIGDILYVFSTTAYEITEDTDAEVIKIQLECIPAYEALNASLKDKFEPINYKLFCVKHPEWADYYDDYSVTVRSVIGGTVIATPNGGDEGEEIALTITPNTGCELVELQVKDDDGNDIEVTDNKFLMPASNVTVNPSFDLIDFTITVDDNIENGTLSAPASANLGDTVTITATPATGYALDTLTVMCGSLELTVVDNQFTMPAGDVTVTGTFELAVVEYNIIIEPSENGEVQADTVSQYEGETVYLNTYPWSEDYVLSTLTVTDANSNPVTVTKIMENQYQFTMPSSDATVSATFVEYHDINIASTTNGYIETDSYSAIVGETITITTTPYCGYELGTITVTDENSDPVTVTNSQFIMPDSDVTVSATFVALPYAQQYFTIESLADNNDIKWISGSEGHNKDIDVSFDGIDWQTLTSSASPGTTLATLMTGEKIFVKGSLTSMQINFASFGSTGNYKVYGNIMSLVNDDEFADVTTISNNYQFNNLFKNSTHLTDASNLILPATTLTSYCYHSMFEGCSALTTAPALPATTLVNNCYDNMFKSCTSLTTAPMLAAPTLVYRCYINMFNGCSNLNSITCLATDISAQDCTSGWVGSVSSSGTFTKDANMTNWPVQDWNFSSYPPTWTVQDYTPSV